MRYDNRGSALDLLEDEDLELRRLFRLIQGARRESVDDRAEYEDLAKVTIRHLATREAAVVEVTRVLRDVPDLHGVVEQFEDSMTTRRVLIDRVERMSRGVLGINLNQRLDFDGEFGDLIRLVGTEIEWDLDEALPAIRGLIGGSERADELKSADHVARHAPTSLSPKGPRWYERAPVISRLITWYDHMREFPRAKLPS